MVRGARRREARAAWLWLALASGLGGGCGPSNQDACRQYVVTANREYDACGYGHLELDLAGTCPAWLNLGGADCTAYYRCLETHADCVDGEIDFAAMEACTGCR